MWAIWGSLMGNLELLWGAAKGGQAVQWEGALQYASGWWRGIWRRGGAWRLCFGAIQRTLGGQPKFAELCRTGIGKVQDDAPQMPSGIAKQLCGCTNLLMKILFVNVIIVFFLCSHHVRHLGGNVGDAVRGGRTAQPRHKHRRRWRWPQCWR